MGERVRLRPTRQAPPGSDGVLGLAALFALCGLLLLSRPWWSPAPPDGLLVRVDGAVASPGTYLVDPPTLDAAVEAAGGRPVTGRTQRLHAGDAVFVGPDGARVIPSANPLLVALPVDVNAHDEAALAAVPGLSDRVAQAIVRARADGPYFELDDLARVAGVGPDDVEAWGPLLTVGAVGERPFLDLNAATARQLERLPGIGPSLAARIVQDRSQHGPFATVDALARVRGVGPATLAGLRDQVEAR